MEKEKKIKCQAPGGIKTINHLFMRHALYRRVTTTFQDQQYKFIGILTSLLMPASQVPSETSSLQVLNDILFFYTKQILVNTFLFRKGFFIL